jgi:hypothetical protein
MTKFQLKQVSLACGLALGTLSLANVASAQVGGTDVFVSGATAQNINLQKAVRDICGVNAANTRINSPAGIHWFCASNTVGIAGTISVSKESSGGSGNGVLPVLNSTTALNRPQTNPAAAGCTTVAQVLPEFPIEVNCTANNALPNKAPDAGVSDVEPRLLVAPSVNVSGLPAAGTVAVQFGFAASNTLAARLAALPNRATTGLLSSEARALLTGNLVDWSQIGINVPNGSGTTAVKICRRGPTSGTQKAFEVRMLAQGCAGSTTANNGALLTTVQPNTDDSPNNGSGPTFNTTNSLGNGGYRGYGGGVFTVVANQNAEDVDACLTAAENQGELAIGLLSLERAPGAANDDPDGIADGWQFVNLDGVAPTIANLINGGYDNLWTQATFNRRASGYPGQVPALMNALQTKIGDPVTIISEGLLGVAGLPSNGFAWTGSVGNPVMRGERRLPGGDTNNCQEALFGG